MRKTYFLPLNFDVKSILTNSVYWKTSESELLKWGVSEFPFTEKFMCESNLQHFSESCITSILCCEISITPDSLNVINFTWNYAEINIVFTQNHQKKGKIVIHGFYVSCKWWDVEWRSSSIHVNFSHNPSILQISA